MEQFYDDNLTPDFTLDFLGIFQLTPLSVFVPQFISILDGNKVLNTVPGAWDYISLNESDCVVRNNEIVTSVDFAIPNVSAETFESLHFRSVWTLTREKPYNKKPWKLKRFATFLDIRFPQIGDGSPAAEDTGIVGDYKHDKRDNHGKDGWMNFSEEQVYFVILCLSILVILMMVNTFCLLRYGWSRKRGRTNDGYKYSGVKTIVSSDEDFVDDLKEINV